MATAQQEKAAQQAMHDINKILGQIFGRSQARFRYFWAHYDDPNGGTHTCKKYAFGWSTERVGEEKKFYAFIYRITKKGSTWKIIHKVSFGKRRVAKARAAKWRDQYQEKMQRKLLTPLAVKTLAIIAA